jgi:hemoglobin/transferrin/lactoferrin receptor protein
MQRFLLIIAMFWCVILVGQNVTVLDYDTKFPIQHCLVYGEDSTDVMYTDKYGIADLTKFEKNEVISFQHT